MPTSSSGCSPSPRTSWSATARTRWRPSSPGWRRTSSRRSAPRAWHESRLRRYRAGRGHHMYERWFLSSYFWIGLVLLVLATAFFFSPLIALAIAAVVGIVLLFGAGMRRTREHEARTEADAPTARRRRAGVGRRTLAGSLTPASRRAPRRAADRTSPTCARPRRASRSAARDRVPRPPAGFPAPRRT